MRSGDRIPELPPVSLDGLDDDARSPAGPAEPAVPGDRRQTLSRWLAAGLALALAFTLGVVVTDARRTASAEQDVSFVAGTPYRGGLGNPQGRREIRVNLPVINTGTAPGRIVGLRIRGFEVVSDVSLNAQPGSWTTIRTAVIPDCDVRGGRQLDLTVETPGGRQNTVVAFHAGDPGMTTIWSERCDASAVFQALIPTGASIAETREDSVLTSTPMRTDLVEDVTIRDAAAQTNGLDATADGLPVVLSPPQNVTLRLNWTVTDCAAAQSMTDLRAGATIEIPERGVPPTITTVSLPTDALLAVARFVEAQCEQ